MTNPSPIAFSIFGKDIYWYGIIIAVGVLLAIYLSLQGAKKYGWKQDDILDFAIFAIPSGIIGARLYYVIFAWENYAHDPITALYVWQGGVAIFGAVIGGLICGVIFTRVRKLNMLTLMDIIAPGLVLAQAMGRWGNFFNQEAYGIEVTNASMQWFPLAVKIDATQTIHYATFFYESMWCLLIFAFLMTMRNRFRHKGDVFLTYIMLYAFERMFVEGLRTDSLMWGPIRVSQVVSLLLVIATIAFFIVRAMREKKNGVLPEYAMLSEYAYKKKDKTEKAEDAAEADEEKASDADADEGGKEEADAEKENTKED